MTATATTQTLALEPDRVDDIVRELVAENRNGLSWHTEIARRTLVACPSSVDDLARLAAAAHRLGLSLAARGSGSAYGNGRIVLDLSNMGHTVVNPHIRTVRVHAGATHSAVDRATHRYGLAAPSGGKDLREVALVLTDGAFVVANESVNEDLFHAVKRGESIAGIVVSSLYQTRKRDAEGASQANGGA